MKAFTKQDYNIIIELVLDSPCHSVCVCGCRNTGFRDEHHFHLSYATDLDTERGVVYCTSSLDPAHRYEVAYDRLVIGVGADCNHFNIPGVLENAFFLKVVLILLMPMLLNGK